MKYMIGFITGTIFGAVLALLYAPMSGDELRGEIRREADTRYNQMQQQVQKGLTDLNTRVEKLSSDVRSAIEETRKSIPAPKEEVEAEAAEA